MSTLGSPPARTPPVTDSKLSQDSGSVFREINAARLSTYPLEPAVRALQLMQPELNLRIFDIVGCGSTIGNLLGSARSVSWPFRFDLDLVRDTVFFVRKGKTPYRAHDGSQGLRTYIPESLHDLGCGCALFMLSPANCSIELPWPVITCSNGDRWLRQARRSYEWPSKYYATTAKY
jgi:hypothetical protein